MFVYFNIGYDTQLHYMQAPLIRIAMLRKLRTHCSVQDTITIHISNGLSVGTGIGKLPDLAASLDPSLLLGSIVFLIKRYIPTAV